MPVAVLLAQKDEIPDVHLEPVLNVFRGAPESPAIEAVAAPLDIDEFRVGRVTEAADDELALDGGRDGPFQIRPVPLGLDGGDEYSGHGQKILARGPGR